MSEHQWGRVDADGTVWVRTADGERAVGQYPGASEEEALAYFARKYDDLAAQINLLEQRIRAGQVSPSDAESTAQRLEQAVREANAVGDLDALLGRLQAVAPLAAERRAQAQQQRQAAREQALTLRTQLVEEAEGLADGDPERIPWKASGDRLRELFDDWRRLQREARLDKHTEDDLWRRFSHARTTFDRKRRHYFGALDEQRAQSRQVKEQIVAEAEGLASSTDWGSTATAFRELMARWKAAGRASRRDDDALWARFRAAQDAFFGARQAAATQTDSEFRENLARKEALLAEAEALLPVRDSAAARAALREVQERWEAVGKVPRGDVSRMENRLRRVETAVREAESERWRRSNPEARARAEDVVRQLEEAIVGLRRDLDRARSRGDERRIRDTEQALQARTEWLEQARQALSDFTS